MAMTAPTVPQFSYSDGAVRLPSMLSQRGGSRNKERMDVRAHDAGCGSDNAPPSRRGGVRKPILEHIENLATPLLGRHFLSRAVGALLVLLSFFVLSVGAYALWTVMEHRHAPVAMVGCRSASCHAHIAWLAAGMDPSADACCDAEAYACRRVRWHSDLFPSTLEQMKWQWSLRGSRFLQQHQRPAEAFALYSACISDDVDSAGESQSVLSFLKEMGLPWPYSVDSRHRHILDVVLDLNINWGVQLWFQLSLRRLPGESRYSLRVSAVPTTVHWQRWLSLTSTRGARLRYALTFYALFDADGTPTSQIEDLLETEEAVNQIVSRSVRGAAREARSVRLGEVGLHTPNISSALWMAFLGAHLRPHELRTEDRMLLVDNAPFALLNRLLARFTNGELLRCVAWWFVQEHALVARNQALHTVDRPGPAAADARLVSCYAAAESRYESTLLQERVASARQQPGLDVVTVIFRDIKAAASRLLSAAAWVDAKARKEAVAIVSNVTLEPWYRLVLGGSGLSTGKPALPALPAVTEESMRPRPHRSVFYRWLDAARQHKLLAADWPLDDSLLQRHSRLVEYDAWWNSVYLDPSVGAGLLIDAGAPPPALYGSLAGIMAQAVVQALDYRVGTFLDSERKLRDWLSPATRRAFLDRAVCAEREDILMGVAAVAVLVEAYRTSVANESDYYDLREIGTRLTPEMLLFVAFCRSRCTLGRSCNELVRHVAAYSEAFGCATRAVKCSFFGE